jgi:hypothetical protein
MGHEDFEITGKDAQGKGVLTENGFLVKAGSLARRAIVPSAQSTVAPVHQRLIFEGILEECGVHLKFTRDYSFDSPSGAASVMLGRTANGWNSWRSADGRTLGMVERDRPDAEIGSMRQLNDTLRLLPRPSEHMVHDQLQPVRIAKHPINLSLPTAPMEYLQTSREAVNQEYRNSIKCKRLICRKVTPLSICDAEQIYILEVGQSIEFDWTWEGAVAFRPKDFDRPLSYTTVTRDISSEDGESSAGVWSGEIVEVDEVNRRLFVWISELDHPPTTGTFYVRPFEFLEFLNAIYNDLNFSKLQVLLPPRLNACRGNVHPQRSRRTTATLPQLKDLWKHHWAVLWGPPGTGKTYTIGQQLHACLRDSKERILVVSTTNKATDEAALSIGQAAASHASPALHDGQLIRIGKSTQYHLFEKHGLLDMLRGTETELLRQLAHLNTELDRQSDHEHKAVLRKRIKDIKRRMKDASYNVFVSCDVRIVVATSFQAITLLAAQTISTSVGDGAAPSPRS